MIDNDRIQAALILKASSSSGITTYLSSGTILEYDWQGTDQSYPGARIHVESQTDISSDNESCPTQVDFSWYIFSEQRASKQANQIANAFVQAFRGSSFTRNNIKFSHIRVVENIPAIRQDARTWRAQVRCQSVVHDG